MSPSIKVKKNPQQPNGRWFEIEGKPQTIREPLILKSSAEAYNAGFMMADRIFDVHKAAEVRLYSFGGHDHIAVFLKNAADWDKKTGSRGGVPIEKDIEAYIASKVLRHGFALQRDMSDKPKSGAETKDDISSKMEDHLQKIKPETVDQHGGKVRVIEFNNNSGVLKIGLGKACSTGCKASSFGTKAAIAPRMRSRFPQISSIDFIFE